MKRSLMALFAGVGLMMFTQCKKDDGGSNTTPTPNYSPLTAGSSWTYRVTDSSSVDTVTLTASTSTKVINGKTYMILLSDAGDTSYRAHVGGSYYRLLGIFGTNIDETYLKDSADVNGTWSDVANVTLQGIPVTATLKHTLVSKTDTRTVASKSYSNLLHVKLDISGASTIYTGPVGTGDFYYADGIGLVDYTLNINVTVPPIPIFLPTGFSYTNVTTQQLLTYQIK